MITRHDMRILSYIVVLFLLLPFSFSLLVEYAFAQPPEKLEILVAVEENAIVIVTEDLTARIPKSPPERPPEVTFFFTSDKGEHAMFRVAYACIIGFNDTNNNNLLEMREAKYELHLFRQDWNISDIVISEKEEFGRFVEFELTTVADFLPYWEPGMPKPPLNAIINDWAIIKFRFFIVSHDISPILYPSTFSYQLSGETELKIDIKIEILHPTPVEKLCIEHLLFENEEGGRNHAFNMYEKEGRRLRKSTVVDTSPGHQIKYVEGIEQKIGFALFDGRDHGYYKWLSLVRVTYNNDTTELVETPASYRTDGKAMELRFYYPNTGLKKIEHDPSISVVPANAPLSVTISPIVMKDYKSIFFNLGIGFCISAAIVSCTFAFQKKRMKPRSPVRLEDYSIYRKK
jgi:hypothetical protein